MWIKNCSFLFFFFFASLGCSRTEYDLKSDNSLKEEFAAPSETKAVIEIPNFHKVNDNLFRSGRLSEKPQIEKLKQLGIKTVLSLDDYSRLESLEEDEKQWVQELGMGFEWLPMSGVNKPTLEQIYKALAVITAATKQPVLVHCKKGSDRTGIVVAAYRIKYDHWTVEDAKKEMKTYGHSVFLNWWDDILDEVK